jgi:2'-5' RNA ligase
MAKKAVDVVLLPEQKIAVKAIELNAQLAEKFGPRLVLNEKNCLPHISLAMGCIDEKDLTNIENQLKQTARQNPLNLLEIIDIKPETNAVGETVLSFKIKKNDQLQSLHEQVMENMQPFFKYQVNDDMLFGTEVEFSTLIWIRDYREKASFYRFSPHITLGYGEIETTAPHWKFKANSLALCHLGNHCTCRDVLISIVL